MQDRVVGHRSVLDVGEVLKYLMSGVTNCKPDICIS